MLQSATPLIGAPAPEDVAGVKVTVGQDQVPRRAWQVLLDRLDHPVAQRARSQACGRLPRLGVWGFEQGVLRARE